MYFPAFVKTVQAGSVAWRIVRRFYSLIDKQLPEVSESGYSQRLREASFRIGFPFLVMQGVFPGVC